MQCMYESVGHPDFDTLSRDYCIICGVDHEENCLNKNSHHTDDFWFNKISHRIDDFWLTKSPKLCVIIAFVVPSDHLLQNVLEIHKTSDYYFDETNSYQLYTACQRFGEYGKYDTFFAGFTCVKDCSACIIEFASQRLSLLSHPAKWSCRLTIHRNEPSSNFTRSGTFRTELISNENNDLQNHEGSDENNHQNSDENDREDSDEDNYEESNEDNHKNIQWIFTKTASPTMMRPTMKTTTNTTIYELPR